MSDIYYRINSLSLIIDQTSSRYLWSGNDNNQLATIKTLPLPIDPIVSVVGIYLEAQYSLIAQHLALNQIVS